MTISLYMLCGTAEGYRLEDRREDKILVIDLFVLEELKERQKCVGIIIEDAVERGEVVGYKLECCIFRTV